MNLLNQKDDRLKRALLSMRGVAIGDPFGEMLSVACDRARERVTKGDLPPGPWRRTDDAEMALGIFEMLHEKGEIHCDRLIQIFAKRYANDPERGYGKGARKVLDAVSKGTHWAKASMDLFGGGGSMGNGAAMRVAPLGAYFADDLTQLVHEAQKSAVVTHGHLEGQAGAVAVAVAAAMACKLEGKMNEKISDYWKTILDLTLPGKTREGIEKAAQLPLDKSIAEAVSLLGNGFQVISHDTVPFCLWCAARHAEDFQEAMVACVEADGDCDTNCAIVGGIVALASKGVPQEWENRCEPLPDFCLDLNVTEKG